MAHLTDIEIAQQAKMQPITQSAAAAGIDAELLEPYGKYKARYHCPCSITRRSRANSCW